MQDDELARGEGLLLSGVAGAVDGVGYVLLRVFTAHITGNTVHVGTDAGRLELATAWRPAFAIVLFVAGVAAGALTREACARRGIPTRPAVLAVSAALLVAFVAAGATLGAGPGAGRFAALAAPAALAMGCQNAVMPKIAGRRVKTYITGTMTEFAEALTAAARARGAERARSLRHAVGLFGLWFTYLVGGCVSGAAGTRWGVAAALFPLIGIALAIAIELRRRRSEEAMPRVVA